MSDNINNEIRQIGYVVRSVENRINYLCSLGCSREDFRVFDIAMDPSTSYRYEGRDASCTLRIALTTVNGIDHEYIEQLDGEHPSGDFLRAHGEGINHVGLYVDDIAPWVERMKATGARVTIDGWFHLPDGKRGSFAYLEQPGGGFPLYEFIAM